MKTIASKILINVRIYASHWIVTGICFLFSLSALWLHTYHSSDFRFGERDLLYSLEAPILDSKLRYRGPVKAGGKVGVLAIDNLTIERLGRWPISRVHYQKAFEHLKSLGVRWIGLDVVFSEPERTTLEAVKNELSALKGELLKRRLESSPADSSLVSGIQDFGDLVLGYSLYESKWEAQQSFDKGASFFPNWEPLQGSAIQALTSPNDRPLKDYIAITKGYGLNNNIKTIAESSIHSGFYSNNADSDAINRWVTVVAYVEGQLMPALSLKTAAEFLNREIVVDLGSDGVGVEKIDLVHREDNSSLLVPVDSMGVGRVLLNPLGPRQSIPHFSLAKAVSGTFSEAEKKQLKGMMLLLGPTSTGIADQRPNAFDASIDGVENHATVAENIIEKRFLSRPTKIFEIERILIIIAALILTPGLVFLSAFWSGFSLVAFVLGLVIFDHYFWFAKGIWAFIGLPIGQSIGMYSVATLVKFMIEEREKRKVRASFGQYVSPDVVNQILKDPDNQKLGGQRRDVTIFFSDVRGFTDISEKLSAEKLGELMNCYFNAMTPPVLASGGTLDKFIGDAIMAFWGAPIPMADHADRACAASLRMLYALDELRGSLDKIGLGHIKVDMGIGLNTGVASVGNFGSSDRFCYTVMGDSVNLASRLESLTKQFGVKILVSETVRAQCKSPHFFFRDLAIITVKGKEQPVRVFELMKPEIFPNVEMLKAFIAKFEEGRANFQIRNWDSAEHCFEKTLEMRADDIPSKQYLEEILEFRLHPPVNWDGVKHFKTK